jgi:hypothetical protein
LGENPGAGQLVIVEVVRLHLAEAILDEKGYPDPHKMDVIARMGAFWYARIRKENIFWMKQPRDPAEVLAWQELPPDIRESRVLTAAEIGHLLAHRPAAESLLTRAQPTDPEDLHRRMQALLPDAVAAWDLYLRETLPAS